MVQMKPEGHLLENPLLLGESGLFALTRPLTDWVRPTHSMEDSLLTRSSSI